ncbi:hypothetical protein [Spirochaeta cellobiosiphila]|uniref:DUF7738 domain-containing protein n=1 Tax=Spirochaeta cellobiosiphila TaxID=504483 RepID=UPI0003FCE035|nr:hypothetical protein [Spirochaeta cellobiosiphila]
MKLVFTPHGVSIEEQLLAFNSPINEWEMVLGPCDRYYSEDLIMIWDQLGISCLVHDENPSKCYQLSVKLSEEQVVDIDPMFSFDGIVQIHDHIIDFLDKDSSLALFEIFDSKGGHFYNSIDLGEYSLVLVVDEWKIESLIYYKRKKDTNQA